MTITLKTPTKLKEIPPEIQRLRSAYRNSRSRIEDKMFTETKMDLLAYQQSIAAAIEQEQKVLKDFSTAWVNEEIPKAYGDSAEKAFEVYRKKNIDVTKVKFNEKVLKNLTANTIGVYEDAIHVVGRRINDEVRKIGVSTTALKVATGARVDEAKKMLLERFKDENIFQILDKNGRNMNLESYAELVARTTTREATNRGAIEAVKSIGYDLVQISQHFSACPLCSVYEGRVYSVSGDSPDYPSLDEAFSGGYDTIHPNCCHVAVPYIREFDDKADELQAYSNRPFEVDPDKKASIDKYHADQAKKIARRDDMKKWEAAKLADPKGTPKTLSGFKKMASKAPKVGKDILEGYDISKASVNKAVIESIKKAKVATRAASKAAKAATIPTKPTPTAIASMQVKTVTPSYPMVNKTAIDNLDAEKAFRVLKTRSVNFNTIEETQDYLDSVNKKVKALTKDADLIVRRGTTGATDILENGRFKTQFETGKSSGGFNPTGRAKVEKDLFNAPIDLDVKERPVYGMLDDHKYATSYGNQYGNIYFELDKKAVIDRTTVCFGDSWDDFGQSITTPVMLKDVDYHAVNAGYLFDLNCSPPKAWETLSDTTSYVEIQIHGGLDVSVVKRVVINNSYNIPDDKLNKIKTLCDSLGIPWVEK